MANIRQLAERDLKTTLEGDFGLPVILISPEGEIIEENIDGETLKGQVLYDTVGLDLETGERVIDNNPVVTLRRSSLSQVPIAEEAWAVKIPVGPTQGAAIELFKLSDSKPPEDKKSLGIIKLYLEKVAQV